MTAARLVLIPLSLAFFAPLVGGLEASTHHAEHVTEVQYTDPAARGNPIPVTATLVNTTNITDVRLIYCRVQHYACGPALEMASSTGAYTATIPWTSRFFDDVRMVGLRIEMQFQDGRVTHSPIQHYPSRPADLPPEGDTYYYFRLHEESSSVALVTFVLAALVLAAVMRR